MTICESNRAFDLLSPNVFYRFNYEHISQFFLFSPNFEHYYTWPCTHRINGQAPLIRSQGQISRCDNIHFYCISDNNGLAVDTVEVANIINVLSRNTPPELDGINAKYVMLEDLQLVVLCPSLCPLF